MLPGVPGEPRGQAHPVRCKSPHTTGAPRIFPSPLTGRFRQSPLPTAGSAWTVLGWAFWETRVPAPCWIMVCAKNVARLSWAPRPGHPD